MEIKFMPQADKDLAYWKATGNQRIMKRITKLLEDILFTSFYRYRQFRAIKG